MTCSMKGKMAIIVGWFDHTFLCSLTITNLPNILSEESYSNLHLVLMYDEVTLHLCSNISINCLKK